jgi:hypothetical protein
LSRFCVIREGKAVYLRREDLTAAERADVEERERSPLARMRFGVLLRYALKAEDVPLKADVEALRTSLQEAKKPKVEE